MRLRVNPTLMRGTLMRLVGHFALLLIVPVFALNLIFFSPNVLPQVVGAGLIGASIGFTLWLIGTTFDLACVGIRLLLLSLLLALRP